MHVESFVVSPLQSNCYVLSTSMDAGAKAVIVDPGDPDLTRVFHYIDLHEFTVEAIWCTHGHFDHVLGADRARQRYNVPAYLHEADVTLWKNSSQHAQMWLGQAYLPLNDPDGFWRDGEEVDLDGNKFEIWHTPGHSPGGVCIIGTEFAFTGDTLFAGTIGRTDFPESNAAEMEQSLYRLTSLPGQLDLYPGHMQATTMNRELSTNPFLMNR